MRWTKNDNVIVTKEVLTILVLSGGPLNPRELAKDLLAKNVFSVQYSTDSVTRKIYNTVYIAKECGLIRCKTHGLSHYSLLQGTVFVEVCNELNIPLKRKPKNQLGGHQ